MNDRPDQISIQDVHAGRDIYIALGGARITIGDDGLPGLAEPRLKQFELAQARDKDGVDLFRALRWDYGLVEKLYGRSEDLKAIVDWAEDGDVAARACLLTGGGGSGKTRLGAEAAFAMREKGWTAGFIPADFRNRAFRIKEGNGLFLILDYPEESPDDTRWLLRLVADLVEAPCKIRILLLSRRGADAWVHEAALAEGRFAHRAVAPLTGLSVEDGVALVQDAARRFGELTEASNPRLDGVRAWLERAEAHRMPLFAIAAAIHVVLEPAAAFDLDGPALMRDLARREKRRVDEISHAAGLGRSGLAHLLALAVLADGLDQAKVETLARAGAVDTSSTPVLDRVRNTPWWRQGRLQRLEPDRPAAAFLDAVLFPPEFPSGRRELPTWLFEALKDQGAELGPRLSRVFYDLSGLHPDGERATGHPLDGALAAMLEQDPARVSAFDELIGRDESIWMAPFLHTIATVLLRKTSGVPVRAALLNNLANSLSSLGRPEDALAAAEEATALYQDLAYCSPDIHAPDLAMSLNTLAVRLAHLGRLEDALAAAQEATACYRDLASVGPNLFAPEIAGSLINLAARLSDLGRREEALAASQEAVALYRDLARANPEIFTTDLAMSVNNLGGRLYELDRRDEALAAAREATAIYRDLARAAPDIFTANLATSLTNVAAMVAGFGQLEEALAAAQEATALYRDLARAHPDVFTSDLARSLANLSSIMSMLHDSS